MLSYAVFLAVPEFSTVLGTILEYFNTSTMLKIINPVPFVLLSVYVGVAAFSVCLVIPKVTFEYVSV